MKFFKYAMVSMLMCCMVLESVNPKSKQQTKTTAARRRPQPAKKPARPQPRKTTKQAARRQPKEQPIQQPQSYAQALDIVRKSMPSDKVIKNNVFTNDFINFVKNSVTIDIFARALFEAGANIHAVFTGNMQNDINILMSINDQINRQINLMKTAPEEQKPVQREVQEPVIKKPEPLQKEIPQTPLIVQKPIIKPATQEPFIKKTEIPTKNMYLVHIDAKALKAYDLCPLFTQRKLVLNKEEQELAEDLRKQGHSEEKIAQFFGQVVPHYSVFNERYRSESGDIRPAFENKDVAFNVPCVVPLGQFGNWNRMLMQLKSLDQFELADRTGLSPALCAGHSLNNGRLMRGYALTGASKYLTDLHDINSAANFLLNLRIGDWLNVEVVREKFVNLRQDLGVDGVDVSAVSTLSLFDANLDKKPEFAIFNPDEFTYVQKVKKNIQEGLKQENYVHIMIIGNEETVEVALGHYFCFAIIKVGNEIQYVVLDTVPSVYHLHAGSHERNRLMFVIENIEKGSSLINVANIRTKLYLKNVEEIGE